MIDICFRDWSGSSEEHLRAYLLKTSILGEIVFEILAPFCSRLDTIPFKFDRFIAYVALPAMYDNRFYNVKNQVKLKRICMESSQ